MRAAATTTDYILVPILTVGFAHLANQKAVEDLGLSSGREEELGKISVLGYAVVRLLTKEACPLNHSRGENPETKKMDR